MVLCAIGTLRFKLSDGATKYKITSGHLSGETNEIQTCSFSEAIYTTTDSFDIGKNIFWSNFYNTTKFTFVAVIAMLDFPICSGDTHLYVSSFRYDIVSDEPPSSILFYDAYVGPVVVGVNPFLDNKIEKGVDGSLVLLEGGNEDDIDGYNIYYGSEDFLKAGDVVTRISKTDTVRTFHVSYSAIASIAPVLIYAYRG
jgi:hypothetical protein